MKLRPNWASQGSLELQRILKAPSLRQALKCLKSATWFPTKLLPKYFISVTDQFSVLLHGYREASGSWSTVFQILHFSLIFTTSLAHTSIFQSSFYYSFWSLQPLKTFTFHYQSSCTCFYIAIHYYYFIIIISAIIV